MKVLLGFFGIAAAMVVLVVSTVVSMLIQLLPYLVLMAVALLVARGWGGRGTAPPVRGAGGVGTPRRALPAPPTGGYRPPPPWVPPRGFGAPPRSAGRGEAAVSGWAWMPVWIGPPPAQPRGQVIDAEIVEDDDG